MPSWSLIRDGTSTSAHQAMPTWTMMPVLCSFLPTRLWKLGGRTKVRTCRLSTVKSTVFPRLRWQNLSMWTCVTCSLRPSPRSSTRCWTTPRWKWASALRMLIPASWAVTVWYIWWTAFIRRQSLLPWLIRPSPTPLSWTSSTGLLTSWTSCLTCSPWTPSIAWFSRRTMPCCGTLTRIPMAMKETEWRHLPQWLSLMMKPKLWNSVWELSATTVWLTQMVISPLTRVQGKRKQLVRLSMTS